MKKLMSLFLTAGIIASVLAQSPRELVNEKAGEPEGIDNVLLHPALQIKTVPATCAGQDGSITLFLYVVPITQDGASLFDIGEQEEGNSAYWSITLFDKNDFAIEKEADVNETVSFTGLSRGKYSILLKDRHGYHRIHKDIELNGMPPVNADFEMNGTNISVEEEVYFRNYSEGATLYEWDFGDGSPIVSSEHASHNYKTPGIYEVTLTALNNHCSARKTVAVTVSNKVTGITTASEQTGFHAYADRGGINVVLDFNIVEPARLTIYDMTGKQVASEEVLTAGMMHVNIASGDACFLVHISMKGQSYARKVFVSRN